MQESRKIAWAVKAAVGWSILIGGCAATGTSVEDSSKTWTDLERSAVKNAHINWENASPPLGRYVLIREGNFLCAIRFTNFIRGNDKRPGSFWTSGEETETSIYEWKVLAQERASVRVLDSGEGEVRYTAPHGFGHLVIGGGYGRVRCGHRKIGWSYPAQIDFNESGRMLAPTPWNKIEDIRLNNPGLIWYPSDPKRKDQNIPLAELERRFSTK